MSTTPITPPNIALSSLDIVDIMAAQDQIKEAVQAFKVILAAASTFDGEEVIQ